MLYNPRAFIAHAALLRQAFAHCAIFPTAASRRSLDRVSVPVWLIILSDQLSVFGLVGHYPTNYLMDRGPILQREVSEDPPLFSPWSYPVLARVSPSYPRLKGRLPTCYSPVRRYSARRLLPLDLHVLGTPPAFVLSQDQTLEPLSVYIDKLRVEDMLSDNPSRPFELSSPHKPAGDQPAAIEELQEGLSQKKSKQTLLGVTGSGKTFTAANVIADLKLPTLVMAPNKTLAAQLFDEFRSLFPHNAVEYFVSYYDYYQPEAYVPSTDTFIDKDSTINDAIDRMRHSATQALFERDDVIIVSSVSCIYGWVRRSLW